RLHRRAPGLPLAARAVARSRDPRGRARLAEARDRRSAPSGLAPPRLRAVDRASEAASMAGADRRGDPRGGARLGPSRPPPPPPPGGPPPERLAQPPPAAHLRSPQPPRLTDVASTDVHTVKPWFVGRLSYSPLVVDLGADGFPLVGGRLDVVDGRAVAALVYSRRQHVVNVFVWPAEGTGDTAAALSSDR